MNIAAIQELGKKVIDLLEEYYNPPHRELALDPILFAYLRSTDAKVSRQHYVYLYGSQTPQRIDFRIGGNNPVLLELAVRWPNGGETLYGRRNSDELCKLCRVNHTAARLRALLLLDLAQRPFEKDTLKANYDKVHAGRGNFTRCSVRVIYVHRESSFHFSWSPFRTVP